MDLNVDFEDDGGGVQTAELRVDGQTRTSTPLGGPACVPPYVVATPCATRGPVKLLLDTVDLASGSHIVEVVLRDVAGNQTTVGPYGVWIRDRAQVGSANAEPSQRPLSPLDEARSPGVLSLEGARTRRVSYRQAVVLNGVVKSPNGAPMSSAPVSLSTRQVNADTWSAPTTTTTDAKGRFELAVPPGPSRELRLSYGTSVQTVKLVVTAPVRLKTDRARTRNGRSVKFTGSVPGAGVAKARVELQAWAGKRWVPFRTTALRNGRFSASYRFTSTYRTTRYRFRAVVHEAGDFPYASGRSPVVNVVVRP